MRPKITLIALAVSSVLLPVHANAATFEVNSLGDDPDPAIDGRCDVLTGMPGRQCTLRSALMEANELRNLDRIEFDPAVFDGTLGDAINADLGFLPVSRHVEIDAGDCGAGPLHQPCAGVDADDGNSAFVVVGDGVSIRGLAIYGSGIMGSGVRAFGADKLRIRNSWFGRRLNGTSSANGIGISLEVGEVTDDASDEAVIGGKRARDANVFGGGSLGVYVEGGDNNQILGNLFGVDPLGTALSAVSTPVSIDDDTGSGEPAVGNVVGTKVSRRAARTPECDGGCNAITNGLTGISLDAAKTTIAGNFLGLRPDGASALENDFEAVLVGSSDRTTIGGGKRERNSITGGRHAWTQQADSRSLEVRGNLIGFDSTGQIALDPPDGTGGTGRASLVSSVADAPSTVSGNHYALAPNSTGLSVFGEGAVVTKNTFGLTLGGGGMAPAENARPILVVGAEAKIGKPGAGNVIGNMSWSSQAMIAVSGSSPGPGDDNVVQGNLIGVDAQGDPHPITGGGIGIFANADGNRIGGATADSENVISNVSQNPIQISPLGESPSDNEILRNHGSNNGTSAFELFVNLQGASGFGNGDSAVQDGIEAPVIEAASRTSIDGEGAEPGAKIWIYATRDSVGFSPQNVRGFVAKTTANGSGVWSESFDQIPAADNLTALQTDADAGSSELALAADP